MSRQVAGPMWSGPLHNNSFITKVLGHLESNQDRYSTAIRMKGMLTVANEVRSALHLYYRRLIPGPLGTARAILFYTIPDSWLIPLGLSSFG